MPARSTDRRQPASSSALSRYRLQASLSLNNPPSIAASSSALRRMTQCAVDEDGRSSIVIGPSGPMTDVDLLHSSTANSPFARPAPLCVPRSKSAGTELTKTCSKALDAVNRSSRRGGRSGLFGSVRCCLPKPDRYAGMKRAGPPSLSVRPLVPGALWRIEARPTAMMACPEIPPMKRAPAARSRREEATSSERR